MAKESWPQVASPTATARYVWLDKPDAKTEKNQYGNGKFKVTLLVPKTANLKGLLEAVTAAARQKWGPTVDLATIKKPFSDGDTKGKEGFAGMVCITAQTQYKPTLYGVDALGKKRELGPEESIWAGDTVRAGLLAFPYENTEEQVKIENGQVVMVGAKPLMEKVVVRGVTFQLCAVQLVSKGERVGQGGSFFNDEEMAPVAITGVEMHREVIKAARPQTAPVDPRIASLF